MPLIQKITFFCRQLQGLDTKPTQSDGDIFLQGKHLVRGSKGGLCAVYNLPTDSQSVVQSEGDSTVKANT